MGCSGPWPIKFLMFSRMELPQPLWGLVPAFNLLCIKYWLGLLALYGLCKDLWPFWLFLMSYSPLTTSDSFFTWQLSTACMTACMTAFSLRNSLLEEASGVVVPPGAGYCVVLHHYPHCTGLKGDPGLPCPLVVITGAFPRAPSCPPVLKLLSKHGWIAAWCFLVFSQLKTKGVGTP